MALRPKPLAVAALVSFVIGAHACGQSRGSPTPAAPTPTATPTPTPTPVVPEAVLEQSGRIMETLETFHFLLEHNKGGTPLGPSFVIHEAEGDVVKPDKLSAEFSLVSGGIFILSRVIALGDDRFISNPFTGAWETLSEQVSPLGFFNPRRGIAAMMSQVSEVSLLPDGEGVYQFKGRLPPEALSSLLGSTVKGTTISAVLTIDAKELRLLKAVLDGRVKPTEEDGLIRVITLSRFNEPVTIEPPQQR